MTHRSVCRSAAFIASSTDRYQRPPVLAPHEQRQRQAGLAVRPLGSAEISLVVPATPGTVGPEALGVRANSDSPLAVRAVRSDGRGRSRRGMSGHSFTVDPPDWGCRSLSERRSVVAVPMQVFKTPTPAGG